MIPSDYCRHIEAYLCRRNDGHLIRIVGPAFDMVRGWEAQGIPIKVARQGIDRMLARRDASGPARRRPVRIEFCEADVLDAFDAWRRAVGVAGLASTGVEAAVERVESSAGLRADDVAPGPRRPAPLARHIDRAMSKLTQRRLDPALPGEVAAAIDAALTALDGLRARAKGARGSAREDVRASLTSIDDALARAAAAGVPPERRAEIDRDARRELAPFAGRMSGDAHARALAAATARLVKGVLDLPDLADGI